MAPQIQTESERPPRVIQDDPLLVTPTVEIKCIENSIFGTNCQLPDSTVETAGKTGYFMYGDNQGGDHWEARHLLTISSGPGKALPIKEL